MMNNLEWHNAKDNPPALDTAVFTCTERGHIAINYLMNVPDIKFDSTTGLLLSMQWETKWGVQHHDEILYWMDIPELPKGVKRAVNDD